MFSRSGGAGLWRDDHKVKANHGALWMFHGAGWYHDMEFMGEPRIALRARRATC
jgi:hypothetical protein